MAHLVKPWIVRWVDKTTGKRVKPGSPNAKKVKERANKWYGVGIPGRGKKRVPLAGDKRAAEQMLRTLVTEAERGIAGVPVQPTARLSLAELIAEFQKDVGRGMATRSKNGQSAVPDPKQVGLTAGRVRDLMAGCDLTHPGDLNDDAPGKVADYLQARAGKPKSEGGMSHQTAAFYLAVAGWFAWWLSKKKRLPVRADLFEAIPGFQPKNYRVHARRDVSAEDLAKIIDTARASQRVIRTLTGPDRAMLYLTAFATGYRAGELAELCPANFAIDVDPPTVSLPGKFTKNGKPAVQPIPPGVAAQLRTYLAGRPKTKLVWPGTWIDKPAFVLRRDLKAAGVPYKIDTGEGPK